MAIESFLPSPQSPVPSPQFPIVEELTPRTRSPRGLRASGELSLSPARRRLMSRGELANGRQGVHVEPTAVAIAKR